MDIRTIDRTIKQLTSQTVAQKRCVVWSRHRLVLRGVMVKVSAILFFYVKENDGRKEKSKVGSRKENNIGRDAQLGNGG